MHKNHFDSLESESNRNENFWKESESNRNEDFWKESESESNRNENFWKESESESNRNEWKLFRFFEIAIINWISIKTETDMKNG